MIIRFMLLRMGQGRRYAIVAENPAGLRDEMQKFGADPQDVLTCGSYDEETEIMDRTHPDLFSDDYVRRMVKMQIAVAQRWREAKQRPTVVTKLLSSIFFR